VPTTSIIVMGDGMADWLAYGLEEAFSDSADVAIVRKNKINSGLVHYESKGGADWPHAARDILTQEKANFVVMMIGLNDRQDIRGNEIVAVEADKKKDEKAASSSGSPDSPRPPTASGGVRANGNKVIEFRSDEWAKFYSRRIDEVTTALKSKGVPVFWVGLPPIRGTKSTAAAGYLNDLYRARAERDGAIYIDVWDGFVDEGGKYTNYGPDYEGQIRRLRSGDGVFFTKYGARKLAHYVEREIRRYMSDHISLALPSSPAVQAPRESKPAARPLAGPVVPLTATPDHVDALLSGAGSATSGRDEIAAKALGKGEPLMAPRGRADNFMWSGAEPNAVATPLESKSSASPEATSALASVPPQRAIEKNKPKKAKTPKKNNRAKIGQNMFEQSIPMNQNNRRPRERSQLNEPPSWRRTNFPWLAQ
jgi:hypothetical protein